MVCRGNRLFEMFGRNEISPNVTEKSSKHVKTTFVEKHFVPKMMVAPSIRKLIGQIRYHHEKSVSFHAWLVEHTQSRHTVV